MGYGELHIRIGYMRACIAFQLCLVVLFVIFLWWVKGLEGDRNGMASQAQMGMIDMKAQGIQTNGTYSRGTWGLIRIYGDKTYKLESDVHMTPTTSCPHETYI